MSSQKNKQKTSSPFVKIAGSIRRHKVRTILISTTVVIVLGGGAVAAAANGSKPGDPLYSLDTALEKIQLALAFTDGTKATVHQQIAKERLAEIQELFKEKELDAPGIAVALASFEEQKHNAISLAQDAKNKQEVENTLASYETQIDKLFESQQANLEKQREMLKNQAEVASQAGDTALATQLRAQADALDNQLRTLEVRRETSKQVQEQFMQSLQEQEQEQTQEGATSSKSTEAQKEAVKQQQEALQHAVEQEVQAQNEAAQKIQEQQREADKQAQEQQKHDQEQQQEQERQDQ